MTIIFSSIEDLNDELKNIKHLHLSINNNKLIQINLSIIFRNFNNSYNLSINY